MPIVAVHQFHAGTALGDAITDQMLRLQRTLHRRGLLSQIYAEHIDPALADRIRPVAEYADRPGTLLLVHHSMGHSAFDHIARVTSPIATVFHSITPPTFFDDRRLRCAVHLGFEQLQRLATMSVLGIADSNHNRKQMLDAGFTDVDVLPVKCDFEQFRAVRAQRWAPSSDWLFVGRLVPNKRQDLLVAAFGVFHRAYDEGHLHLVGDVSDTRFVERVREAARVNGVEDHVVLHGKIESRALAERYRDAGVYVSASEHEGFGVPLLEAMAAAVPVVALDRAAVAETMGGAGVLLSDFQPSMVAALVRLLFDDHELRARLLAHQDHRLLRLESFEVSTLLDRVIAIAEGQPPSRRLQIQGPFETSYSLAVLNRELALALDRRGIDVSIFATEGPGDYAPATHDLLRHPRAAELFARSRDVPYPDVAIRQMYPPRVHDSPAALTFQYFGWEESGIPPSFVGNFNRHLDGIGTMSTYVRQILLDAGVTVPIEVVGVGVHTPRAGTAFDGPELGALKRCRFLHISSAFPRKGVDVLLSAYFAAFSGNDDVTLVLKTFPNPHNDVGTHLRQLRAEHPDPPDVRWIDRDIDRDSLDALYSLATCYVHPARGEGFGIPVAEAMLAGVPVVATAAGGLAELVRPDTADVVPHRPEPARTHLTVPGSVWFEPSLDELTAALRRHAAGIADRGRIDRARAFVADQFSWDRVAGRWLDFVQRTYDARIGHGVVAVSTFNSRCGIAEYTAQLYSHMTAGGNVVMLAEVGSEVVRPELEEGIRRVWLNHRSGPVDALIAELSHHPHTVLHVQWNFGFFTVPELGRLLASQAPQRPTVVTLHRTLPLVLDDRVESLEDIADELRSCDAVIVHQGVDVRRLADCGVVDNVRCLPIGVADPVEVPIAAARRRHDVPGHRFVVGAYGFLLPHKGLLTTIAAVDMLGQRGIDCSLVACCALHPDARSARHLEEVRSEIDRRRLGDRVDLYHAYLPHAESLDRLACADVIAMPYHDTEESASAAVRSVIPLCRPIVTSTASIFDDVGECVIRVEPMSPAQLADALEHLWRSPEQAEAAAQSVRAFAVAHSWSAVSALTRRIYADARSLYRDRSLAAAER